MANYYVSSVAYAAVAQWAASTTVSVGQIVRQLATPTVNNERCWICTTAGTTGASEPSWVITKGSTTSDNGVVWTEITGQEAYQSPGNWAAPFARLQPLTTINAYYSTLGTVFVASNHAETSTTSITIGVGSAFGGSSPLTMISVNSGVGSHVPPQSSDILAGASITETGNNTSITFAAQSTYIVGFTITISLTVSNPLAINFNSVIRLDNCSLYLLGGNFWPTVNFKNARSSIWNNVGVFFSDARQSMQLNCSGLTWRNAIGVPAFIAGSTAQNNLFTTASGTPEGSILFCEGLDLSLLGSRTVISIAGYVVISVTFQSCKVGTTDMSKIVNSGSVGPWGGLATTASFINCSTAAGTWFHGKSVGGNPQAIVMADATVVRTGGASDGTNSYSWLMNAGNVTNVGTASWAGYLESFPIAIWNASPGTPVSYTIYGVWNQNRLPNNDEIWLNLTAFSSAANSISAEVSGTKSDVLAAGSPLTADTSAWGTGLTPRANSTAYLAGNASRFTQGIFGVASNPDRVFFCTTGGTTAATEPAGYATAVDGSSVTDGTAVFTAGVRFSQTLTITPQAAGFVRGYIRMGNPVGSGGAVAYIDPMLD